MLRSNPPYALWSIWIYLDPVQKLFLLTLCIAGIYFLFSSTVIVARLRAMTSLGQKEDRASMQRSLAAPYTRYTNAQQLIRATFYLFGLVLFFGLQRAYLTIDESKTPVGWLILENFVIHFAFAANVFSVFLTLHLVQWFVSSRLRAYNLQSGTYNVV